MLEGKKILLGISGSIAAYKMAVLTRLFVKAGMEVKIIMTPSAHDFVTPTTLSTLSKNPVYTHFTKGATGEWTNHVELGLWADLLIIAPLTANTLSKMVTGHADNLLLATYLSAKCKVLVAPAMDLDMFIHPSTQNNINTIKSYGNIVLDPNSGELASGLEGKGRMVEPEEIFEFVESYFNENNILSGKKVLLTAGPTYEHIDPVRFIGNHSSGKMGFALAERFAELGAQVTIIAGPSTQVLKNIGINRINIISAAEMLDQTLQHFSWADIVVMSAAVADYTPEEMSEVKIKKSGDSLEIKLRKTKDILKELGQRKMSHQLLIGFALETDNEEANAKKKMNEKKLDFIVLNSLKNEGAGFGFDTNKIQILHQDGRQINFDLKSKKEVAIDIVDQVIECIHE